MESELDKKSLNIQDIQDLINKFDINRERYLNFDEKFKEYLDIQIKNREKWEKIAFVCRRMIICDRELDLTRGKKLIEESIKDFEDLENSYEEQPYETIRYNNSCGLISYRRGNYSDALDYFNKAKKIAENSVNMKAFIPDTTSNIIRTKYELDFQFLPNKIKEDHIKKFEHVSVAYINKYVEQIEMANEWEPDNENIELLLIFGHGMASLYHNLGEIYYKAFKLKSNFEGYSLLLISDIEHLDNFLNKLYNKSQSSSYLLENLRDETRRKISEYRDSSRIIKDDKVESVKRALIDDLNQILKEPYFFSEKYFPKAKLKKETIELINKNPQNVNFTRFKRLILEDFFPEIKRRKLDRFELKEKAKKANESSLEWGKRIEDVYRQLQSKRALSEIYENLSKEYETISKKYEKEVFEGRWKRGRLMIYQKLIRNSKTPQEVNSLINDEDFELDVTEDMMATLYNYNAIHYFLINSNKNTNIENIFDKDGHKLTRLKIAEKKIEIADELRNILSPLLYKRQIMQLIRDDVGFKNYYLLTKKDYFCALNFNEKYSNRSIVELARTDSATISDEQNEKISILKKEICHLNDSQIENAKDCNKLSIKMSTILDNNTDESLMKLMFTYEEILRNPSTCKKHEISNEDIGKELRDRLKKIPDNTAIIKFFITEFDNKPPTIWSLWIDNVDGKIEETKIELDLKNYTNNIKRFLKNFAIDIYHNNEQLYKQMDLIASQLNLSTKINAKKIKNLFIIPDGELFQVPLYLLDENGQDLRKRINVYYSPSLTQLLKRNKLESSNKTKNKDHLWICSPTKDLYINDNEACLKIPDSNKITTLECTKATLNSFIKIYTTNNFTHVGFSTHSAFHDDLVTAYISFIRFHDSFLTLYDILFKLNFSGVKTIFLGTCCGGSTKYTDENEAVGLVIAFLAKEAQSVIAPLCIITKNLHNKFIEFLDENNITNQDTWNLSDIFKSNIIENSEVKLENLIPFVQYANLEIIEETF